MLASRTGWSHYTRNTNGRDMLTSLTGRDILTSPTGWSHYIHNTNGRICWPPILGGVTIYIIPMGGYVGLPYWVESLYT